MDLSLIKFQENMRQAHLYLVFCSCVLSFADCLASDSMFEPTSNRLSIPYVLFQNKLYQAELSYLPPDKLKLEQAELLADQDLGQARVPVYDDLSFHLSTVSVGENFYAADLVYLGENLFQINNLHESKTLPSGNTSFESEHFSGSGLCALCHNDLVDEQGRDVSMETAWRSSMMANSSRDPFWQAKVISELARTPTQTQLINDTCSRCHAPMANEESKKQQDAVQAIFDPGLLNENNPYHDLFLDGVSCTLCHQIAPDGNFGTDAGYSGNFSVSSFANPVDRLIYGQYDGVIAAPMRNFSGYTPVFSTHISSSEHCASCHDLTTPYTDEQGNVLTHAIEDEFPEQMPYTEWLNSEFNGTVSCQQCHMEKTNGVVLPIVHTVRNGFAEHTFLGSNVLVLSILQKYKEQLGVSSVNFSVDIKKAEQMLADAATIEIKTVLLQDQTLSFDLHINSLTGHKLPSGYPSRRIIVHVEVRDLENNIVFETGKVNSDGSVVGLDTDSNRYQHEPHYQIIESPEQVQVYEAVMQDYRDIITYTLLRAKSYRKDNRILPKGFDKQNVPDKIKVRGAALEDSDFSAGGDTLHFKLDELNGNYYNIKAELVYQPLSFAFAQDLFEGTANEISNLRQMFNASNMKSTIMVESQTVISK